MFTIETMGCMRGGKIVWMRENVNSFAIETIERNGLFAYVVRDDANRVTLASCTRFVDAREAYYAALTAMTRAAK